MLLKSNIGIIAKKTLLWFTVISLLGSSILSGFLPSAFAANERTISMENTKSLIDEAAQDQIILHVMKKCIRDIDGYDNNGSSYGSDKKTIFNSTDYTTGAWLEKEINGKTKNGTIQCKDGGDKILHLFAKMIGLTANDILCNKSNIGVPGLLTHYVDGKSEGANCGSYVYRDKYGYNRDQKGNIYGKKYENGEEYTKLLYDKWREDNLNRNPYLVRWDDSGDFGSANGYYVILKDFATHCGGDLKNAVDIKSIKSNGGVSSPRWQYDNGNDAIDSITGVERTCAEMAQVLNNTYFNYYKEANARAFKSACNSAVRDEWKDAVSNAQRILDGVGEYEGIEITEEEKAKAQEVIDALDEVAPLYEGYDPTTDPSAADDALGFNIRDFADLSDDKNWICHGPPDSVVVVGDYENPDPDDGGGGTVEQDACYGNGGPLGWILCPIISGMVDLGSQAYQWIEENFLQMNSSIFTDDSNGVKGVWNNIRDITNIGFVIILLFVIFSQLTGVGIDNYGIKKILPKLIICAIMVNLSYYICELAIDLSNIVGSSLKTMLSDMAPASTVSVSAPSGWQNVAVIGGGAVLIAVVAFFAYGGIGAILMLFIALLSCLMAILTLFVILIIRQAGIVMCVIMAPLAMLCYVLPNTDKFYKKWWGLLKGLLIVYPLCGLVVGAGSLMSRIFGNLSGGQTGWLQLGFALSAMLVEVLPFFAVPTLLKSSLAAMGNIGAKISGIGRGLGNKAGNKIKGSDAMKMSKQRANDSKMMRKAGYNEKTGKLNAIGRAKAKFANTKVGSAIGYKRMQASNVQAAGKIASMNKEASASLSSETTAADIEAYMKAGKGSEDDYWQEQINSAGASGDMRKLDAAILTAQKRGKKPKDIMKWLRNAEGDDHLDFGGDEVAKANWMNRMLQEHGDIVSTDIEMQDWMRNSMTKDPATGKMRKLGKNFGDYAKNYHMKPSDFDVSDLAKASGSSMAGLISAGLISSSVAEQYLVSNPNASVDKKIMMGAVKDGKIVSDNAQAIKDDADSLSKDRGVASGAGISSATTFDEVKAWTAPMADRVTIDQQKPNEIPVEVYLRGGSGGKRRRK